MKKLLLIIGILFLAIACTEQPIPPTPIKIVSPEPPAIEEPVIEKIEVVLPVGIIGEGNFVPRSSDVDGDIIIERLEGGMYQVTLTNFKSKITRNAILVLTKNKYVVTSLDVENYYEIGTLKGNNEKQFYTIPKSIPVEDYNSITLITTQNSIVEGSAPLDFVTPQRV